MEKRKRETFSLVFWTLACLAVFSESSGTVFDEHTRSVGIGFDTFTRDYYPNLGLRYSQWFGDFGFEIALSPRSQDTTVFPDFQLGGSASGALLVSIYENDFTDFLSSRVFGFGSLIYSRTRSFNPADLPSDFSVFGGIGFELLLFRHLSWLTKLGYSATFWGGFHLERFSPNAEAAARYVF